LALTGFGLEHLDQGPWLKCSLAELGILKRPPGTILALAGLCFEDVVQGPWLKYSLVELRILKRPPGTILALASFCVGFLVAVSTSRGTYSPAVAWSF